jgi:hypothetical protein
MERALKLRQRTILSFSITLSALYGSLRMSALRK